MLDNEKASLDRPAWTSEHGTGMFEAYKHKHIPTKDRTGILRDYFTGGNG